MTEPRRFTVVTIFPEFIDAFRRVGIVRKACDQGLAHIAAVNPREFTQDSRRTVDDTPYGGGPGMVMLAEPLGKALASLREAERTPPHVACLSPQGRRLDERGLSELQQHPHLVLLAGRYEGIDERVVERFVDSEWSLGDFVMSGGEIAAMAIIDALIRRLPGALGDSRSAAEDSFADSGLLDHPHYSRPEVLDGVAVPPVLLSGNHAAIARWRRQQALGRTWLRRPELLGRARLSAADRKLLDDFIAMQLDDSKAP